MFTEKIDIVMFNMSCYTEWQAGISNRNFHILHTLLKDDRVRKIVMVDYLPFTWKRAMRQWWQNRMHGVQGKVISQGITHKLVAVRESEIERTGYKLEGVDPSAIPFKLFNYSDIGSVWSEQSVYQRLKHDLKRLDLKNIVLWSYTPTFVGYLGKFNEKLSVFDAVDNWLEHSSYTKIKDRLKLNYQTMRYKADLIFTTSPDLVKFFDRSDYCTFVPNGISLEHIANTPKLVGRDIASLPRPIIGYVGTLQEDRIDVDLLQYLAKLNPTKSFVLIGPVWPGIKFAVDQKLRSLPNVHLLGRIPFNEVLAYIREFNVSIIPNLHNEFNRHTNSMKLYEYLAMGKPVVVTPSVGLEDFGKIIHTADTPEKFNKELLKALTENSETDIAKRQSFMEQHTWDKRVKLMLDQIFSKLS
jgi:glycosyltransferase involved in cell wall biosynthesis